MINRGVCFLQITGDVRFINGLYFFLLFWGNFNLFRGIFFILGKILIFLGEKKLSSGIFRGTI
jgi:hypothetical protein